MIHCPTILIALLVGASCQAQSDGMFDRANGEFNVGVVLPIHRPATGAEETANDEAACGVIDAKQLAQATLFVNLIDAVNKHDGILPNISVGYFIVDSCAVEGVALSRTKGWQADKVTFVVGGYNSRVTAPVASFLGGLGIPMIDHSATLGSLSNRTEYPLFARTSPSDKHQAAVLAEAAKTLDQGCVHLMYSDGLYGEKGAADVRTELAARNICIATDQKAPTLLTSKSSDTFGDLVRNMFKSNTSKPAAVICFCEDTTLEALLAAIRYERSLSSKDADVETSRVKLIASDYWARTLQITGFEDIADGTISVSLGRANTTSAVVLDANRLMLKLRQGLAHPWLEEFYESKFGCDVNQSSSIPCNFDVMRLKDGDLPMNEKAEDFYISVMAGLQAVHTALFNKCPDTPLSDAACLAKGKEMSGADLYTFIRGQQVDVTEFKHESPFRFDENGDGPPTFTLNYFGQMEDKSYDYSTLAVWDAKTGTEMESAVVEKASMWPGTNETVTATCAC